MEISEQLKSFLNKDDVRSYLRNPIKISNETICYTNGHLALFTNFLEGLCYSNAPESVVEILNAHKLRISSAKGFHNANFNFQSSNCSHCDGAGKMAICPECEGSGEVELENDYHCYEAECRSCFGSGLLKDSDLTEDCGKCYGTGEKTNSIVFNGLLLNGGLLKKICQLPDIKFHNQGLDGSYICFQFRGGDGLLMARAEVK